MVRSVRFFLLGLFLAFCLPAFVAGTVAQAADEPLTVVYCTDATPFHYTDAEGQPAGLMIDLWRAWERQTGKKLTFMAADWGDTLRIVSEGKADFHAGLFYSRERDEYLDFGPPLLQTETHIFHHESLPLGSGIQALAPFKVGVIKDDKAETYLREKVPGIALAAYATWDDLMAALEKDEVRIFVGDTPAALFNLRKSGLADIYQFNAGDPVYQSDWHIAVPQGREDLLSIADKGMGAIPPPEMHAITRSWSTSGRQLGEDTLVIAIERNYPPLYFLGRNGKPRGMFVDLWKEWAAGQGVSIDFRPSDWVGTLDAVRDNQADIHAGLFHTADRAEWMEFSVPFYEVGTALYFRSQDTPMALAEVQGKRLGAIKGTYQAQYVRKNHPGVTLVELSGQEEMITTLLRGRVDGVISEVLTMEEMLDDMGLQGTLHRHANVLFRNAFHAGVAKGREPLLAKINAGLDAMPLEAKAAIESRWVDNRDDRYYAKATTVGGIELTAQEKAWLRAHPKITIGVMDAWPPVSFANSRGKGEGIDVDILEIVAKRLGLEIEIKPQPFKTSFDEVKNKQLDGLTGITRKPEREELFEFTGDYLDIPHVIVARSDGPYHDNEDALDGKKVAIEEGFFNAKYFKEKYPSVIIVDKPNTAACLEAVSRGGVDAYVGNRAVALYLIARNLLTNLQIQGRLQKKGSVLAIGVRKDWPELASMLDKALATIDSREMQAILSSWTSQAKAEKDVELTPEEWAWVNQHPVIRVAATPDWPPFEFREGDSYQGLAADILKLTAERTGLNLDIQFAPWDEHVNSLKKRELDVVPAMAMTSDREEYLTFSDPIFVSEVAIWVQQSNDDIHSMEDLNGKTVAVEKGYMTHDLMKSQYPDINLLPVSSSYDAIRLVSSGHADAYVGNYAVALYLMSKHLITNLKPTSYLTDAAHDLRVGIRKDWPLLKRILDKGLATISLKEKSSILGKYVSSGAALDQMEEFKLTEAEQTWLDSHTDIRMAIDPNWPPIEYSDHGLYSGLSAEYVKRLKGEAGVSIAPAQPYAWHEALRMVREKHIDLLPSAIRTQERDDYLMFSAPYASFPTVIYQRTEAIPVESLGELDGTEVGVVKGYATEEILRDNNPDIKLVSFPTLDQALRNLSRGKINSVVANFAAGERIKRDLSLFNIIATHKTPYDQDIHFGVRKDWPELVDIINKWLATLTPDDHARLQRMAGIEATTEFVRQETGESLDFTQVVYLGGGLIIVFAVGAVLFLFLRRFIRVKADVIYGSHQYKLIGIVVGILLLCLVLVVTWYSLSRVEREARYNIGEALEGILLTTHDALSVWVHQNKLYVEEMASNPTLRGISQALRTMPEEKELMADSPALWNLRRFMDKARKSRGFSEYAIVNKNYTNLATSGDGELLDVNALSIQRPRILDRAFLGDTIFIPPTLGDFTHDNDDGSQDRAVVSFATPIRVSDGSVAAVLVISYDAHKDFQRIIALGRLSRTGETYAFDKHGTLASESRFDKLLQDIGLVEEGGKAILSLRLNDPGGNLLEGHTLDKDRKLPLTRMAQSALSRKSGLDTEGYRDYRGVPVFGAWLWDNELNLGLATEIDVSEAMGSYVQVRNTVISILLVTILLGSLMTALSHWVGQSAARSLQKAKDELEDRVEERTAELKKVTVAIEQTSATVVITDTTGAIQYVNPAFTTMTGYTWEEAIGQNPRVLKSGYHAPEFYEELWATITSGEVWTGDFLNVDRHGKTFWERATITPIIGDEGKITNYVAVKDDITARKAEEERFQSLLDAAPDAMVIVDQSGEITLVNIATEELFGYSREELIGQKVELLVPESIRTEHPSFRDKFFTRPGDMSILENKNFTGQTRTGELVPVDISLSPIEAEGGVQVIASIRDVTERKKAEEALRESEERTRLILSSAGEGIFGVDLEGKVIFINDAACAMLQYESDELMFKPVHDIIHHSRADGSFYPVEECPMRHAFAEGESHRIDDEVLWRKDGTSFEVEYSAMPVHRGAEIMGAVISFQDITERREAERALRKSEQEVKNILATSEEGFWRINNDGITVEVNDAMLRIMGRSREDAVGRHMFDFLDEENQAIVREKLKERARGETGSYELIISRPDGESVYTMLNAAPIFDEQGEKTGSFGMVADVSGLKKIERDLITAKAETEDALGVVTASIQYASRIQRSVLPPAIRMDDLTLDHFIVWEPRDVVGGDLYWCEYWGEGGVIILGDCTGHGVPGAFMTLLATGALKRALSSVAEGDAAGVVAAMHQSIQRQLGQNVENGHASASDDGLELGVCYLSPDNTTITFAGARMPLFIDRGDQFEIIKGDKKGIGYRGIPYDFEYTNQTIRLEDGLRFYMTTDGIIDQIGGEKRRGFGKKRFIALLESLRGTPLQNQGDAIYAELITYQGQEKRRDDVSIVGFEL